MEVAGLSATVNSSPRVHVGGTLVGAKRFTVTQLRIRNATRGTVVAERADVADTSAKRREGLLNRASLEPGEGLWISRCEAVHCFFMKFAIDVVFLSKSRKVLKLTPNLKPWRLSACFSAHSVLELPAGTLLLSGTRLGDQLEFERLA